MFERFRAKYQTRRDAGGPANAWRAEGLLAAQGYDQFAAEFAGASFAGGLYRIHDDRTGPIAVSLIRNAFPEFTPRVTPFAYDWLGRQFAVDQARRIAGQLQVLLLEPGTGEALEIPSAFDEFHETELVDYDEAALAVEFFNEWSRASGGTPLHQDNCVGYRVPLFLGGNDVVDNLEVTDLDVYWSICGQLRLGALSLPRGSSINKIARR